MTAVDEALAASAHLVSKQALMEIERAVSQAAQAHPSLSISWGYRHVMFDHVSVDIDIHIRPRPVAPKAVSP